MKRLAVVLIVMALTAVYSSQASVSGASASGVSPRTLIPVPSDAAGLPHGASGAHSQRSAGINITVSLDFRNVSGLNSLLSSLYNPGSPLYHHWLSPRQFYDRFGPYPSTVSAVESYMESFGARVTSVSSNGILIHFTATEGQLQKALGITFYSFRLDGKAYYTSTGQTALPYNIAVYVTGIQGLQDYVVATHPSISSGSSVLSASFTPSPAPSASAPYNPATIREAYNFTGLYNRGVSGKGVSVAIVTAYTFVSSELQYFDGTFGISAANVRQVQPDGATSATSLESTLDAEWLSAIAPNATITEVEGPNAQLSTFTDLFNYIVANNISSVVSTSWGTPESGTPSSTISQDNGIFKQGAAEGIAFTTASGDFGAYDNTSQPTPDFPSSSPYVTAVGGTWLNLTQSGKSVARYSETGWSKSGGGVSSYFQTPSYQSKLPGSLVLKGRGVPDVSFSAMPSYGYFVYYNSTWYSAGGTSFGAPIWAGILALENQLRNNSGESNLGFANPSLYEIAIGSNYSSAFYDITSGYNGYYTAGPGYDLVTGLGTPNVNNLDLMLARIPTISLSVKAVATPSWGDSPLYTSLFANITGGFAPYTVRWYENNSYAGSGVNLVTKLTGAAVYHFEVTVKDNVSGTSNASVNVTVYGSSGSTTTMNATASPGSGDANLSVTFTPTVNPVTAVVNYYLWAFGDSYRTNTSFNSVKHTYTMGGNFTVLATAYVTSLSSPRGYYTVQAMTHVKVAPLLKALIAANRTGGSYPLHLKLEAGESGGTPGYTYSWSYSNDTGTHSSSSSVVFVNYSIQGTYSVSLSVKDSLNKTASTTMKVIVYSPMIINISVSPSTSGVAPFNVTFSASVSGGAGGYYFEWLFDNTSRGVGNPVTHVFQSGGKKVVTLTVTDLAGDVIYSNVTLSVEGLGLLNLLRGQAAFAVLAGAVIIAAVISYAISRRRKR